MLCTNPDIVNPAGVRCPGFYARRYERELGGSVRMCAIFSVCAHPRTPYRRRAGDKTREHFVSGQYCDPGYILGHRRSCASVATATTVAPLRAGCMRSRRTRDIRTRTRAYARRGSAPSPATQMRTIDKMHMRIHVAIAGHTPLTRLCTRSPTWMRT